MMPEALEGLDWDKGGGLLPAIVQHAHTGRVLMLGYMNLEALQRTLQSGRVTFFSRSRSALWIKGETSGHFLELKSLAVDCDRDTLLVHALPAGPVCHRGTPTCFPEAAPTGAEDLAFLDQLAQILRSRIATRPEGSYTAQLLEGGPRRMAQKVGEEGVEVALAAVADDDDALIAESADLVFHLMLLLEQRGLGMPQVVRELQRRHDSKKK